MGMIQIDIDELSDYFKNHTLKQCAKEYGCSKATIIRRLRLAGIDTSAHNHGPLAYNEFIKTVKDTSLLTKEFLYKEYIVSNKDSKTIALENNFHYNTIRSKIKKYGFKKDQSTVSQSMMASHYLRTGYMHPGHRPDVQLKTFKGRSRYKYINKYNKEYLFKSLYELCFALLLDNDNDIINWDYELIRVLYIDRLTGKSRMYYVDFSYQSNNGDCWIEVKPNNNMTPTDKRLYAAQDAKRAGSKFRGLYDEEREEGYKLFIDGFNYDKITFKNPANLKINKTYTLYFKSKEEIGKINNDHYIYEEKLGPYYKCKFVAKSKNKSSL